MSATELTTEIKQPTVEEVWNMAVDTDLICDYFEDWDLHGNWQKTMLLNFIPQSEVSDKTVLDIGSGAMRFGTFILPLLSKGMYIGVDPFDRYVALARKIAAWMQCEDRVNITHTLNFDFPPDAQVDFAMCQSVFTHLSEPQVLDCLNKMLPIMKKGSTFVFTYITTKYAETHHKGRYYMQEMPIVGSRLPSTRIFQEFADKHGLTFEDNYNKYPHPTGQLVAVLTF